MKMAQRKVMLPVMLEKAMVCVGMDQLAREKVQLQ